jgi:GNAT superfamily N-acetyltransferase
MAPDIPRWVEARGMLVSSRCLILGEGEDAGGYVLVSSDGPLISVVGRPSEDVIREGIGMLQGSVEILASPDARDVVSAAVDRWECTAYAVQTLGSSPIDGPRSGRFDVRVVERPEELPLDHAPEALRQKLLRALRWSAIAAIFVDDKTPVAFCYASWQTETLWDVGIDTIEDYRRRGFATACVCALVRKMHGVGKRPVWGALDTNMGAMLVAKKVGFRPIDQMILFNGWVR